VLAQLGYIQIKDNNLKKFRYPLFDTHEAHGHNHFLSCFYVDENGWWKQISTTNDEPANGEPTNKKIKMFVGPVDGPVDLQLNDALTFYNDTKSKKHLSPYRIGCFDSFWMMHVAINLYNENGLFADTFPLIDTMTKTGEIYSFFGRKFDLDDYK
jgi:hypothetical protein